MENKTRRVQGGRATPTAGKLEYRKPEVKKQGNLKKITALSFQPPG
jgi:hypothetical protein